MTTRDNIIFYAITVGLIFIVGGCLLWSHISKQTIQGGEMNEEKQSMIEVLAPYAAIISAISAFVSTGVVIWATCFRKTRRERMDELKTELQVIFGSYRYKGLVEMSEEEICSKLKSKFQKSKYASLHRSAYDELTNEGKNTHVNLGRRLNEGLNQLYQAQNRRVP